MSQSTGITFDQAQQRFLQQAKEILEERKKFFWVESGEDDVIDSSLTAVQATGHVSVSSFDEKIRYFDYSSSVVGIKDYQSIVQPPLEGVDLAPSDASWVLEMGKQDDGQYLVAYGPSKNVHFYPAALCKRQLNGIFLPVLHFLVYSLEEGLQNTVSGRFWGRYMDMAGKGYVQTQSLSGFVVPVYVFEKAQHEDRSGDYVVTIPPFLLSRPPLSDPVMKFSLIPEKLVLFDIETAQKWGNEAWAVGIVVIDKGKITDIQSYYISDTKYYLDKKKIPNEYRRSSDEIRNILLVKQAHGFILCAKGCVTEFLFMLHKSSGMKVAPFVSPRGYMIDTNGPLSWYPFGIYDLQVSPYDTIQHYYRKWVPKWVEDVVTPHYKMMQEKDIGHVPAMECVVFFLHWKTYQEEIIRQNCWMTWKKFYIRGKPVKFEYREVGYWDYRVRWMPSRVPIQNNQFQTNVSQAHTEVLFFEGDPEGVVPPWAEMMDTVWLNLREPRMAHGIMSQYSGDHMFTVRVATFVHQLYQMPVSARFKDSVDREKIISSLIMDSSKENYQEYQRLFNSNRIAPLKEWNGKKKKEHGILQQWVIENDLEESDEPSITKNDQYNVSQMLELEHHAVEVFEKKKLAKPSLTGPPIPVPKDLKEAIIKGYFPRYTGKIGKCELAEQ